MASMQKSPEERAQSAAQRPADELSSEAKPDHHEAAPVAGGILGSVQESARSVMGAVRGTFSGSGARNDDGTAAAAGGSASAATGKDAAADKAWGVMDAARGAAERARDLAAEKKEAARQALAGDAVARKGETNESAWQQGQDVRRRAAEKAGKEEARRSAHEHGPSEAEKGRAATENIYGKAWGATGAFGEKMVMPTDVVERVRAEAGSRRRWRGGDGGATDDDGEQARRRRRGGGDDAGEGGGPHDRAGVQRRRRDGRGGHRHAAPTLAG